MSPKVTHPATNKRRYLLALAVGVGVASPLLSEEPTVSQSTQVAVAAFELWGKATVDIADAISSRLMDLLGDDRCFAVVPVASRDVAFVVEGSIHSEPRTPIAALRIVDPKTGHLFWSENYDYTNITGDMMAADIYKILKSGTRCVPE
jgi:hypothetical protein